MTKSYCIYSLNCPITKDIKYIGYTCNIKRRYKEHISCLYSGDKTDWIKSLLSISLKPEINIIKENLNLNSVKFFERKIIKDLIKKGEVLFNKLHNSEYDNFSFQVNIDPFLFSIVKQKAIDNQQDINILVTEFLTNYADKK